MHDDPDLPPAIVTADDVAAAAGLSRWTVARAFRPGASISEQSRRKVLEVAERLGYAPNLLAASLASDRSHLVALLVDDFNNPHKLVMMERLSRILRQAGWDTLLVNLLGKEDTSSALLNASQRQVDAAILIGIQFDEEALATALGARRVRKLIIFARTSSKPNTISICCDDKRAMTAIFDYVTKRGYRRPLFLAGPPTYSAHLTRKETFLSLWTARFGALPEACTVEAYDPGLAYAQVVAALGGRAADARPDLLVCENDALAIGAMDGLRHELGLHIPQDIAVTGFDDVPQAANPNYALTTYRQPITQMAEHLVEVLKGTAEAGPSLRNFEGRLIARSSA